MREFELIPIHLIGKMLKGFSYCNFGSSMMFGKIAKSIKLAQHEINFMKLAEYSYWFSKASENMQAGFGVYHIA